MEKFKTVMIVAILIFLSTVACVNYEQTGFVLKGEVRDDTISDIAYDKNKNFGYTVYIKENGEYEPYLVLTKNYNEDSGNVLLLRKDLLNEQEAYHSSKWYYGDSLIDEYLREKFLPIIDSKLRYIIVSSEIEIAPIPGTIDDDVAIADRYKVVNKINRKVFLLSFIEMGFLCSEVSGVGIHMEGKPLKYFKKSIFYDSYERRVAYRNGEPYWYLLRTPVKVSNGGGDL